MLLQCNKIVFTSLGYDLALNKPNYEFTKLNFWQKRLLHTEIFRKRIVSKNSIFAYK